MDNFYSKIHQQINEKARSCDRNPDEITLIAVTKNYSECAIEGVYRLGGRDFGESRVQEALTKMSNLPEDCKWHFIGTLQSNKVSKIIPFIHLIHSVDSYSLAEKISRISEEKGCITSVLLQVNTSGEAAKHGLSGENWELFLEKLRDLDHIRVEGLMTMAPRTKDREIIRSCFRKLRSFRESWRDRMREPLRFRHLSMGMSQDFLIAIEEGATLIRVGSALFSEKNSGCLPN